MLVTIRGVLLSDQFIICSKRENFGMNRCLCLCVAFVPTLFCGFVHGATANTPPTIVDFSTFDNPGVINTAVTYSLKATDPDSTNLTYSVAFGDGTPNAGGALVQGTAISIAHTFTRAGTFSVVA